jgi:hypothetical protein
MSDLMLAFIPLKSFRLLRSRVGAGAGTTVHQNFRPEPEPHKNYAAAQH